MRLKRDRLTAIKRDRTRGALELLKEAVELLSSSEDPCREARELEQALGEMAPFQHLARAACSGSLEGLREFLSESSDQLTRTCSELLDELKAEVVATISRSSAAISCLKGSSHSLALVGESRRLYEGVSTARELAEAGIKVILVVDALLPSKSREMGAVGLIGADRVLPNGDVVNKVGSFPLSLAVPTYVVAGLLKLAHDFSPRPRDPEELGHEGPFQVLNLYFERVPSHLIKAIAFEGFSVSPDEVEVAFRRLNSILGL